MNTNSQQEELYLGIDGGGTKTHALIGRWGIDGIEVLGAGQGGPSNPRAVGFERAFEAIALAIDTAFASSDVKKRAVAVAAVCLAGAGREEEKAQVRTWMMSQGIASRVQVISEAEAVLAAAKSKAVNSSNAPNLNEPSLGVPTFSVDAEVALICGTGSLAWGRRATEAYRVARSGGWGYLLGDEGSGYWLGQQLLQLACREADGRRIDGRQIDGLQIDSRPGYGRRIDGPLVDLGKFDVGEEGNRRPDGRLLSAVLEHLSLNSPSDLIPWCYGDAVSRNRIASLARLVFQLRDHAVVSAMIDRAAFELAEMIAAVVNQLEARTFTLAAAGSVVTSQVGLQQKILNSLDRMSLVPVRFHVVDQPVHGALQLAIDNRG